MTNAAVTVRDATPADNDAIIALELESELVLGDHADAFDRSPDAFACCRIQDDCRMIVVELDGRIVGLLAGVMFAPVLGRKKRSLVYIHRSRVHPGYRHRGIMMALSTELFRWCAQNGGEGPCYAIAPDNVTSLEFVERGGGRWPIDVSLVDIDVRDASPVETQPLAEEYWPAAIELINTTHASEDFFEPLTVEELRERLTRDTIYVAQHFRGVFDGDRLVAVGGLVDKGHYSERVRTDRTTGAETRGRSAALVDWGYLPRHEAAFKRVIASLAAEARARGRTSLTLCEPRAGAITPALPHHRSQIALFTPSIARPASVDGLFFDLLKL
ncbi:MAG: GNAT family N-acetyltransferase [Chloroflexota bacterium]